MTLTGISVATPKRVFPEVRRIGLAGRGAKDYSRKGGTPSIRRSQISTKSLLRVKYRILVTTT